MSDEMRDLLIDMVNRLLADHCDLESWNKLDDCVTVPALWDALTEQGLPFACVSGERGGSDLGIAEMVALARLAGYHACPVPLVETLLHNWLADAVAEAPADGFATVADHGDAALPTLSAHGLLSGQLYQVPWAAQSASIITLCKAADGSRHLASFSPDAADVIHQEIRNIADEPRSNISLKQAPLTWCHPLPAALPSDVTDLMLALVRAAQISGAMERAIEMSTGYVTERVQFGRPLARFQAVQHMLAEASQHFSASAAATDFAASKAGTDDFGLAVAAAKARASEAVRPVTDAVHQVHGAMGFTREYALQFFTRRLWSWRDEAGSETRWQKVLGEHLLAGKDPLWSMLTALAS